MEVWHYPNCRVASLLTVCYYAVTLQWQLDFSLHKFGRNFLIYTIFILICGSKRKALQVLLLRLLATICLVWFMSICLTIISYLCPSVYLLVCGSKQKSFNFYFWGCWWNAICNAYIIYLFVYHRLIFMPECL